MNRRIEIVFDASASMRDRIGKKTKLEIAKEIFADDIMPQINNESNVYLRVLPNNCYSESISSLLSENKSERIREINKIETRGNTPLYKTIKEAIDDSITKNVDELRLIILSDGGDNCSSKINEVIDWNKIKESNLLGSIIIELGQIGSVDRNSLQSLANRINAHRTLIGNDGRINKTQIKKSIQKGLRIANIVDGKLTPCYDEKLKGNSLTWEKLNELYSITKFHANVLFERELIKFNPYKKTNILKPYQVKQIEFLYKIIFKSDLDIDTAINMLHNLEDPYYYDHECIRWDFDKVMWVPIIKQEINEVKISDFSKKEILSQVSVNDFSKEELLRQVSINDFPKSDLLSKVKPEDFLVSDLISALKSKNFSRDEKKQLQEIVGTSPQVFSDKRYYLVSNIFAEFETMTPVNKFVLTQSDCPDKTIILEKGDVIEFK